MIVNTAYIYMGSGGTPVNPNLWQDGVSNYPVVFTNSSISADGLTLGKRSGAATFSELQLTGFNSLTISSPKISVTSPSVTIKIEFFNSADELLGTETTQFSYGVNSRTINIPSSAKIQNAKIRIKNTSQFSATIISALLS